MGLGGVGGLASGPEITLRAVAWCNRAKSDLERIGDVTPRDVAIFRDAVNLERMQLLAICHQGARIGSVIWSTDREPDGFNVVINAAGAEAVAGVDVTTALWTAFVELAKSTGARAVIAWTERKGLARKLEARGARFKYVAELRLKE